MSESRIENNAKKSRSTFFNQQPKLITTTDGSEIKQALTEQNDQDFKYLGSWICSKERDINVRKALAWRSLHKMKQIWKSNMTRITKIRLFRATTESILLYGSGTWSPTKSEEKSLDGTYTRMLRMVLGVKWSDHTTNSTLYGNMERVSSVIRNRRLQLAGHVFRDNSSPALNLITWRPKHGQAKRGRPTATYVDTLLRDTGFETVEDLERCMDDRDIWRLLISRRPPDADQK